MFKNHLMSDKHKSALALRQNILNMTKKGNVISQITTSLKNSTIETRERNRRVLKKCFSTVCFMVRKKWAVKQNFEDLMIHISDIGDTDLQIHFQVMAKNASYMSKFTVDEIVKLISDKIEANFLRDLLTANDFSILSDESSDEAGRAQLAVFVRFIDPSSNEATEQYVCIRKLGTSKTAETLMGELEQIFIDKKIDKTLIRFSGLDGTNAMSGEQKGLQRRIRHVSPFAIYMNCRNHRLALCLVHLLKKYDGLNSVDALLLSIWKLFHYSSIKQAVFENAQEAENLPPLKILKACTTRWLTHGETSIRVIDRFKPLVTSLDALFKDKNDPEAKGIRDILLDPQILLTLLLLAEVLVPINNFCKFLQTRNLNYSLVMGKYKRVISKLETIKNELPNHENIDTTLKYFKLAKSYLLYSQEAMSLGRDLRSRAGNNDSVENIISLFITTTGQPMTTSLIAEINDAMEETSPVLSSFDLFNPEAIYKDDKTRRDYLKTLIEHYGECKSDNYENDKITAIPVINKVQAELEYNDFIEDFDAAVTTLNDKMKEDVKVLVNAKKLTSDQIDNYILSHKPLSTDIYKFLAADGTLKNFPNLASLFKISLLIPPSTSNVERGFSVMNLICTPLRSSLSETNLDRFMRICLNGPEKLTDDILEELIEDFKQSRDNRRLDL